MAPVASAGLLVTANDDAYTAIHDRLLTVSAAAGVLDNDTGLRLSAARLTNPTHGTLTFSGNGGFTYQPAAGYVGSDSFTYEARAVDLLGIIVGRDTAVVTLTVTNAAPTAANDTYSATTGVTLNVPAPGVLGNDGDADGDCLTAIPVDEGGNGSLHLQLERQLHLHIGRVVHRSSDVHVQGFRRARLVADQDRHDQRQCSCRDADATTDPSTDATTHSGPHPGPHSAADTEADAYPEAGRHPSAPDAAAPADPPAPDVAAAHPSASVDLAPAAARRERHADTEHRARRLARRKPNRDTVVLVRAVGQSGLQSVAGRFDRSIVDARPGRRSVGPDRRPRIGRRSSTR